MWLIMSTLVSDTGTISKILNSDNQILTLLNSFMMLWQMPWADNFMIMVLIYNMQMYVEMS